MSHPYLQILSLYQTVTSHHPQNFLCVANAVDQNNDQLLLDYQWTKTDGSVIEWVMFYNSLQTSLDQRNLPVQQRLAMMQRRTTSASVLLENSAPIINSVTIA